MGEEARKLYEYEALPPVDAFRLAISRNDRPAMRRLLPAFLGELGSVDVVDSIVDATLFYDDDRVYVDGLIYFLSPEIFVPTLDELAELGELYSAAGMAEAIVFEVIRGLFGFDDIEGVDKILGSVILMEGGILTAREILVSLINKKLRPTNNMRRYILSFANDTMLSETRPRAIVSLNEIMLLVNQLPPGPATAKLSTQLERYIEAVQGPMH